MKMILSLILGIALLQSCTVGDKQEVAADSSLLNRDTTITAANSYSDLFLDSAAISTYIQQQKLDEAAARKVRNFYNVRNHQYAWFHSNGLTEEGRSFWVLAANGGDSATTAGRSNGSKPVKQDADSLLQKDSIQVVASDTGFINRELSLTHQFIQWAEQNSGPITAGNMYYVVPRKRMDAMQLADSIVNRQSDSSLASDKMYGAMKQQLGVYYNAAKNGGWQPVASARGLTKGAKSAEVTALKRRLQMTNDYPAGDTTNVFSDSLVVAVKDIQLRHGLAPTGTVNDSLITVLNIPAEERVQQLLVNMNRIMWTPAATETNRIEVNLPSQMLYAWEGNNKVLEMPVIIGREGTGTVSFSGKINQVVFNPDWNIPESIVKNEIMPKMKSNPDYLKKNNIEVVSEGDSIPVLRQRAGKDNPLGKVKFLFPNSFDIYLHDTPDKSLFKKSDRALSHGCIRVADAEKLAAYVLRGQKDWTPGKIRAAMNGKTAQTVAVANAQPVQINYFSAWTDATGKVHFRSDINGRDKETFARMFTSANPTQDVAGLNPARRDSAGTAAGDTTKQSQPVTRKKK